MSGINRRIVGMVALLCLFGTACETFLGIPDEGRVTAAADAVVAAQCDALRPCADPVRPFCDVDGTMPASQGVAGTCVPAPCIDGACCEGGHVRPQGAICAQGEDTRCNGGTCGRTDKLTTGQHMNSELPTGLSRKPDVIALELSYDVCVGLLDGLERAVRVPLDIKGHIARSPRDPIDARFDDIPRVERSTKRFDLETQERIGVPPL